MINFFRNYGCFLCLMLLMTACGRASSGNSAEESQADTVPFVLADALAKAKAEKKSVLLEFTGSDWCPPCQMLEKEVFAKSEFQNYKETNLVFGKLDYPRRKEQSDAVKKNNMELQQKFEIQAFPTLVLLKDDGTELWRMVGVEFSSPSALIAELERKKQ